MKNTFGNQVSITLFGESHGEMIGAVIDGLPGGIKIDNDFIKSQLSLRRPVGKISTPRQEKDEFKILSGVWNGYTTGTAITIVIENTNTKSEDYGDAMEIPRPSHADYAAHIKYGGFENFQGGGHFSGRITAAIVAAGAIVISALKNKGILIGTHIARCGGIEDRGFEDLKSDIDALSVKIFPTLDDNKGEEMITKIREAKGNGDSVGGILETAVTGLPAGIGEPWFDSLEGMLSHALFSIPGVKGVEFGAGFKISDMLGSEANDSFFAESGVIGTRTNNSGGINGGISNGNPIVFRTALRPTPTISRPQESVNLKDNTNTVLESKGRHDPCIVHRARVVADSITAITLLDMLSQKYGTDWIVN